MRVIGGSARGRPLRAPRAGVVRPTSDRVREAMFDVLTHLDALWAKRVLDGFGGSGALGIEALSRGASSVTFVEADRRVATALEANLISTGFAGAPGVRIVRGDLLAHLATDQMHYDLALLDPPYAFEDWARLLGLVNAEVVVVESDREIELPAKFQIHRCYRYGTTLVTVARASTPHGVEGSAGRRRAGSGGPLPEPASEARKERA